jgi:hypothetical protein
MTAGSDVELPRRVEAKEDDTEIDREASRD